MKKGQFLFAAVEFLFATALILLGVFCLGLGYVPKAYHQLILFISSSASLFLWLGALFLFAGIALLIVFCAMHKRQYFQVRLTPHPVDVNAELIRQSIAEYLTTLEVKVGCEVWLEGGKIRIGLLAEGLPAQDKQDLIGKLEENLPFLLQQQVGYSQPIVVSVT